VSALSAAVRRRLERRAGNSPTLVEPAAKAIMPTVKRPGQHLAPASRGRLRSLELERIGSGCPRCAPPQVFDAVDGLAALAAKYAPTRLIDAGAGQ
jgi:DNA repair protein RecN (Recombination protein N)